MSAVARAFSKDRLLKKWESYSRKIRTDTTPGIDGIDKRSFSKIIDAEMASVSADVISGLYKFSDLRPIPIPKEGGGIRLINVPTIRDRFTQRVIIDFLVENYRDRWKLPYSFSSMGGGSEGTQSILKDISKNINSQNYIIKADISKYFDRIDRNAMKYKLKRYIRQRSFYSIIDSVIDCETRAESDDDKAIMLKAGLTKSVGLRQGMPLSPILAYLFLEDLDRDRPSGFYRYVDDILMCGESKTALMNDFNRYRDLLASRGLNIHPLESGGKTQLIGPNESFDFLGIRIDRNSNGNKFRIPPNTLNRIKEEIIGEMNYQKLNKRKKKAWIVKSISKIVNLRRNYRGAYGFCSDWLNFEVQLKELQVNLCRKIIRQLRHIEKNSSTEDFLRAFGV